MGNLTNLLSNKVSEFNPGEINLILLGKYKQLLVDKDYFNFVIESKNCGFYFGGAFYFYGYNSI
jgi:hypothetical protein